MTRAVTVVVPAHGPAAQVLPLLRALDAQAASGPPLPVVVSDDASPVPLVDGVPADGLPHLELRIVRDEANGGPGAARNRGLRLVRTPWVSFVDADEVPAADWLARLEVLVAREPAPDMIAGRVAIPSAAGPFEHATEASADADQFVAGNVTFRTERLRDDGGFDERFYDASRRLHFREDADLRFRLERAGRRLAYEPDLVVEHPPLRAAFWAPVRLARRYYFDPLLAREHPDRFRAFVRSRRVGPVGLRRARHEAARLYAGGLAGTAAGLLARRRGVTLAGGTATLAGWALNVLALTWRRRVRPRHVPGLVVLGGVVPLVYLRHFYRGVRDFGHRPRF